MPAPPAPVGLLKRSRETWRWWFESGTASSWSPHDFARAVNLIGFIDAASRSRDIKERMRLAHAIRQETQALGLSGGGSAKISAPRQPVPRMERHEELMAKIHRVRAAGLEDIELRVFPFLKPGLTASQTEGNLELVALNDPDPAMPHVGEPTWHAEWRRWNDKCESERELIRAEKQEAA